MERYTEKSAAGRYELSAGVESDTAVQKLGKYEEMHQALTAEQEHILSQMEKLKQQGKTKTVTYNQLFANKLMVANLLDRLKLYDL